MSLIERLTSALLTPAHKDVTGEPARHAKNKEFAFPTRKQLRMMDSNRHFRQAEAVANTVDVQEIISPEHSIDNLQVLTNRNNSRIVNTQGENNGKQNQSTEGTGNLATA
jgi:hypothetical protein